jgi:hypothetical protein
MKTILATLLLAVCVSGCTSDHPSRRYQFNRLVFSSYYWEIVDSLTVPVNSYVTKAAIPPWQLVFKRVVIVDSVGRIVVGEPAAYGGPLSFVEIHSPTSIDSALLILPDLRIDTVTARLADSVEIYDGPSYFMGEDFWDSTIAIAGYHPNGLPIAVRKLHRWLTDVPAGGQPITEPKLDFQELAESIAKRHTPRARVTRGEPVPVPWEGR